MDKVNLLDLNRQGLEWFFNSLGESKFRASQALRAIHQLGTADIADMRNFSKTLRARLLECAELRLPEIVTEQVSEDGTHKWLLRLFDGNCIESVFIPEPDRGTLCVSSQVGCALNCKFCSTARQGFSRNLSVAEIIGQVWLAARRVKLSNVVMMGMGEPLLNLENVVTAMEVMMDDFGYGLSRRRVTLSTSGVVPALRRLFTLSPVALAISLHAPNDALRNQLVPINRKYPIAELMAACREYKGRRITFEYVMLDGINDTPLHARELVALLQSEPEIAGMVNLIPFNPFPETRYQRSSANTIRAFERILREAGITTITRKTRGDDIDAACGQLVGKVARKQTR